MAGTPDRSGGDRSGGLAGGVFSGVFGGVFSGVFGGVGAALADLVLPAVCAGCGADGTADGGRLRSGACPACVADLESLTPFATEPEPPPYGMPACTALGPYAGPLRSALLAYKEKGRHRLARPLGTLLAGAIAAAAVRGGGGRTVPVTVVPVPSTAKAIRERHGDHMARLAAHAVRRLRAAGWQADVTAMLRARPRPDSASLDARARAAAAESSLRIRRSRIGVSPRTPTMRGTLIVVDDIVTTGATLAAVAGRLGEANMQVTGAAVLAATRLRSSGASRVAPPSRRASWDSDHHLLGTTNEG